MKICWGNLEKIKFKDGNFIGYHYIESCKYCKEPYLGRNDNKCNFCCQECSCKYYSGEKSISKRPEVRKKFSEAKIGKPSNKKGAILSKESRKRISESQMGKKLSEDHRSKLSKKQKQKMEDPANRKKISIKLKGRIVRTGFKLPEETKYKMSISQKKIDRSGSKNIMKNPEISKKVADANRGRIVSNETRKKMSASRKGKNHHFFGVKRPEWGDRIRGENHPNWRGGCVDPYCPVFLDKEWREYIFERDKEKHCWNPQCQSNSKTECLHHINYDKQDCRFFNIIKVCVGCNTQANFNRSWWESFYKEVMRRRGLLNERRAA